MLPFPPKPLLKCGMPNPRGMGIPQQQMQSAFHIYLIPKTGKLSEGAGRM